MTAPLDDAKLAELLRAADDAEQRFLKHGIEWFTAKELQEDGHHFYVGAYIALASPEAITAMGERVRRADADAKIASKNLTALIYAEAEIAALKAKLAKALEGLKPFAEASRLAEISAQRAGEFCSTGDCNRAAAIHKELSE